MNTVEVHLDDTSLVPEPVLVGRLFRDSSLRGDILRFEYDTDWLTRPDAFEIESLLAGSLGPCVFPARRPTNRPHRGRGSPRCQAMGLQSEDSGRQQPSPFVDGHRH